MGLDVFAKTKGEWTVRALLDALAQRGCTATVMMIDGQLVAPGVEPPAGWRDLRLRTPSGTLSLKRQGDGISVVVFGNADAALLVMQRTIAEVLEAIANA